MPVVHCYKCTAVLAASYSLLSDNADAKLITNNDMPPPPAAAANMNSSHK